MSDEYETEKIAGRVLTLSGGRTIWGGRSNGDFCWMFANGDLKTELRLSPEAMNAMVQLFQDLLCSENRSIRVAIGQRAEQPVSEEG